jgi:acetoin utilization deacetylase AcuC-like enzyme
LAILRPRPDSPMKLHRLRNRFRRLWRGSHLPTWFDVRYRLPMAAIESRLGIEPRRADYVVSYLLDSHLLRPEDVRRPSRIRYDHLALVHSHELISSLHEASELSNIFGVEVGDDQVDELLRTVRLACGGTLAAARDALRRRGPSLNLLGGFHHASPGRAAALCPVNDIAVAVATLRAEGFAGVVAILDLDAHPPDGTADCLRHDSDVWIGSLSGSDWGPIDGADETVLPTNCGDGSYLIALADLLRRMPEPALAFVIAGGDVLAQDKLGALGLTLEGARQRDRMVAEWLEGFAQVWLPGGGYSKDAWRVLAGSALAVIGAEATIPAGYDSIQAAYARIARQIAPQDLAGDGDLKLEDVLSDLGARPKKPRLLGYYTEAGVEHGLERYGILAHLRRLGYGDFRVELREDAERGHCRLFARARGVEHLLMECVLELRTINTAPVLYVHWLTLQDSARHLPTRALPGQEHPGLGLARESNAVFAQIADRLGLDGVAFTPSWYHMAFLARERAQFADAARQGRFEAMLRDLGHVPMRDVSDAVDHDRVTMNGEPYRWEASDMIAWRDGPRLPKDEIAKERDRVRFAIDHADD